MTLVQLAFFETGNAEGLAGQSGGKDVDPASVVSTGKGSKMLSCKVAIMGRVGESFGQDALAEGFNFRGENAVPAVPVGCQFKQSNAGTDRGKTK